MATLSVEQAIFSSDNNDRMLGYQLVARSPGVSHEQARELTRWSPSHGSIMDPAVDTQCLIGFSFADHVAIGRSIYGLPEYSGRGGLQTVTQYLITTRQHLAGYGNDLWRFWMVARSHGLLQWNPDYQRGLSSPVMMKQWAGVDSPVPARARPQVVREAVSILLTGRRVAITGTDEPEPLVREILAAIPCQQRLEISVGYGLRPSVERPLRLQLFPDVDLDLRSRLSTEQVVVIRDCDSPLLV